MKNNDALTPVNLIPRKPNAADLRFSKVPGPRMPLTFLARLSAWQSLCAGHQNPSLEKLPAYGIR
jgi:hypothetical protein